MFLTRMRVKNTGYSGYSGYKPAIRVGALVTKSGRVVTSLVDDLKEWLQN